MTPIRFWIVFLLGSLPIPYTLFAKTGDFKPCEDAQVYYMPLEGFSEKYLKRIKLTPLGAYEARKLPEKESDRIYSFHRTRWLILKKPETSKKGNWTSHLYIRRGKKDFLHLSLKDHGSGSVTAKWINEKLLFIKVWWNRTVATDMIVDVEAKNIIYQEMSNYEEYLSPCSD